MTSRSTAPPGRSSTSGGGSGASTGVPGKGLPWLKREVRILELEVAMLQEHELTLPPATYPQRGLELHSHLGWRLRALANRRQSRAWATVRLWIRRGVVFGLLLAAALSVMLLSASQGSPS